MNKHHKLIIYPHGLGDCLMLTPTLRQYSNDFGVKLNVAILERFKSSKIFDNNPYVEQVYPVLKDAWNDFKTPEIGFIEVEKQGIKLAQNINAVPLYFNHPPPTHKILICAEQLGVTLTSTKIDVFSTEEDKRIADEVIQRLVGDNPYGFIQTETGVPSKNLPNKFGVKWLKMNYNLNHFIEVGKDYNHLDYNINVQFEILRKSSAICIPDSVFYHAASGINKNIDFVYFGRGKNVYERVKNLNKNINENVNYKIPTI